MESHAWESDLEMGGDEVGVTRFSIESTPTDALEGLEEATPSEKDLSATEEFAVWRGKVSGKLRILS